MCVWIWGLFALYPANLVQPANYEQFFVCPFSRTNSTATWSQESFRQWHLCIADVEGTTIVQRGWSSIPCTGQFEASFKTFLILSDVHFRLSSGYAQPYRRAHAPSKTLYHKDGDFGTVFVMERSCAVPLLKVDCHLSDRFCTTLRRRVNRYSDLSGSKWVGARTGIYWDGS